MITLLVYSNVFLTLSSSASVTDIMGIEEAIDVGSFSIALLDNSKCSEQFYSTKVSYYATHSCTVTYNWLIWRLSPECMDEF